MIKRIELVNFMSHRQTVIEPAPGLTVLVGPNNCGKSAFVAALQILAYTENSTYVCRHGAKNVMVRVETDDGHSVEWKRERSSSKYVIDGEQFDRLSSNNHREALTDALRLNKVECDLAKIDIHFGEQKSPVFLLRDSARTAADFFASSSDAGRLLKMQARHKQKVQEARSDKKAHQKTSDDLTLQLETLEPIVPIHSLLKKSKIELEQIIDAEVREQQLTFLIRGLKSSELEYEKQTESISALKELTPAPPMAQTEFLGNLLQGIFRNEIRFTRLEQESDILTKLPKEISLPITTTLESAIQEIKAHESEWLKNDKLHQCLRDISPPVAPPDSKPIETLLESVSNSMREIKSLNASMIRLDNQVSDLTSDIAAWAVENPRCPTCGTPVDANSIMTSVGCRHSDPRTEVNDD